MRVLAIRSPRCLGSGLLRFFSLPARYGLRERGGTLLLGTATDVHIKAINCNHIESFLEREAFLRQGHISHSLCF
jgi:hypothetical protein